MLYNPGMLGNVRQGNAHTGVLFQEPGDEVFGTFGHLLIDTQEYGYWVRPSMKRFSFFQIVQRFWILSHIHPYTCKHRYIPVGNANQPLQSFDTWRNAPRLQREGVPPETRTTRHQGSICPPWHRVPSLLSSLVGDNPEYHKVCFSWKSGHAQTTQNRRFSTRP